LHIPKEVQTMPADRIEREILIEAPVDVVWGVVTEPDHIKQWFTDATELDLRPGGAGTLFWDEKATCAESATAHLRVEAVEPPHRFAFRWDFPQDAEPGPDNSLLVEFTLVAEGDSTRLRLVESGFDVLDRPADTKARYIDDHDHGWDLHLARLREYAPRQTRASAAR